MSTSSAQGITRNSIVPASKVDKGSNEPAPGFLPAYATAYKSREEESDRKNKRDACSSESNRKKEEQIIDSFPAERSKCIKLHVEEGSGEIEIDFILTKGIIEEMPTNAFRHGVTDTLVNLYIMEDRVRIYNVSTPIPLCSHPMFFIPSLLVRRAQWVSV